jgi:hypothetical protein
LPRHEWPGFFELDLPEGWAEEQEEGVITLFHADSVGPLQISLTSHKKLREVDLVELLSDFLGELGCTEEPELDSLEINHNPAVRSRCLVDGDFWEVWYIGGPTHVAMITYFCEEQFATVEELARTAIVESFTWQQRRSAPN